MEADKLVELRRISGTVKKLKLPLLLSGVLTVGGQNKWLLAASCYKSLLFKARTQMRVEPGENTGAFEVSERTELVRVMCNFRLFVDFVQQPAGGRRHFK